MLWSWGRILRAGLQAMRPHQWIKNTLLFAGLLFTGGFRDPGQLVTVLLAFAIFCILASGIYLFNDLRDMERDRAHPTKRERPIVSGRLPVSFAWVIVIGCWAIGLAGAFRLDPQFGMVTLIYWIMNLGYTLGLKNAVLLDVAMIASGFVLRAVAGAVVIRAFISPWLIICTFLLALFLGFGKRRHELLTLGEESAAHRESLGDYTKEFLDHLLVITAAATIPSYAIYTVQSLTARNHPGLWYTLPFVTYGLLRYLFLVQRRGLGGSPERVIIEDWHLLISILLWVVMVMLVMMDLFKG